jgi:Spy/CpxP family protein refolding chaperone
MNSQRGLVLGISASLIVGFALGLVVGVLFARSVFLPRPPMGFHHGPGGGPPGYGMMMGFLERRLDLSKEQSEKIERIVEASRAQADSIRAQARGQIQQVLTPEQREKWERMNNRMFPGRGRRPGHRRDEPPPDEP